MGGNLYRGLAGNSSNSWAIIPVHPILPILEKTLKLFGTNILNHHLLYIIYIYNIYLSLSLCHINPTSPWFPEPTTTVPTCLGRSRLGAGSKARKQKRLAGAAARNNSSSQAWWRIKMPTSSVILQQMEISWSSMELVLWISWPSWRLAFFLIYWGFHGGFMAFLVGFRGNLRWDTNGLFLRV